MSFEALKLPAMALSGLRRKGIVDFDDLQLFSKRDLEDLTGVGRKSIQLIVAEMNRRGISFREG